MKFASIIIFLFLPSLINPILSQVIDYSTRIFVEDGEMLVRKSFTIQVTGREDREAGDISIRLSNHSNFKLLNAGILDGNGKFLHTIRKKDLHEVSMRSRDVFFQDSKVVKFNLHWDEYPYRIFYSYEETFTDFLNITNWYPVVYKRMPILQASLELQVPLDYEMNVFSSPELVFSEDTLTGGIRKLSWNSLFYTLPEEEKNAPSWEETAAHVIIMPVNFKYDLPGSSLTWADFGNWIGELNSNTESLPVSEITIIDSLLANCISKEDSIRVLYHYLQDNTNYVNVSIGYGGLKSYPASYVCQNKYGDCKALTTYMKAMLKHVGIESFYTIINTGLNEARILKSFPSQQFNHVILCVPVKGDTLWLENTSSCNPYNYLSIRNQNRNCLLVDGLNSRLIKTPVFSEADVAEIRQYNFHLDEKGIGTISASAKLNGYSFERFSYIESIWKEDDIKEALADYFNVKNLTLSDCNIKKASRDSHYISLSVTGELESQVKDIGELKVIQPIPLRIPDFEKPENRKQSLRFNYPVCESDSIVYHIPILESYNCQLPDSVNINSEFGTFIFYPSRIGNEVKIYRNLTIFIGDYPLEEYPEFFAFIHEIEQSQKRSAIILTPSKD